MLFSDVVSFTTIASTTTTTDVILMLNELFTAFDDLVDQHRCYKARERAAPPSSSALLLHQVTWAVVLL